ANGWPHDSEPLSCAAPASQSLTWPGTGPFASSAPWQAEASVLPSGEKATAVTSRGWAWRVLFSLAVSTSHSLTVLSKPAEASVLPSGLKPTPSTPAVGPPSVAFSGPPGTSQSLIVLSWLAEASVLPSGEKARNVTDSVWPLNGARPLSFGCSARPNDA